jgi:uncharacterized HAD superfamily protein
MHYLSCLEAGERPACGFDLDGVLTFTDAAIFRGAHARGLLLGKTPVDIRHYYWERAFPGEITPAQMAEILNEPGFYLRLAKCTQVYNAIIRAKTAGYQVHLVTARVGPPHVEAETRAWLERERIPFDVLAIRTAKEKAAYCREQRLEFLVEDRFDTANSVAQHCPVLLIEAPYNVPHHSEPYGLAPHVHRVPRRCVRPTLEVLISGLRHRRRVTPV